MSVAFTIIFSLLVYSSAANENYHKYCVVGAGPSGLQLGHLFQRSGRDYIIFEKGSAPGTFFETYPRHDTLISINKIYTGLKNTEFNLRHDWNSLLTDDPDLKFSQFTKDLFPHRKYLLQYLAEYQRKLKIKVKFNTTISDIRREEDDFLMNDQHLTQYSCSVLILATGISTPNIPKFYGMEHTIGYEDMSLNPEDYAGKSVLIIGKGNTAFETATHIYGYTNSIHMMSRERLRLAWSTHYVGDLRAVNNNLLDTYQLKSLDGLFEGSSRSIYVTKLETGELALIDFKEKDLRQARKRAGGYIYDVIIRCMGWKFDFSIFNKTSVSPKELRGRRKKYPKINGDYQSADAKDMYIAGTASHSLDWRKSAGGFIHGFRYTARTLFRILEWRYERAPWTRERYPINSLVDRFTRRVNEGSGLYQMFSALADVAVLSRNRESYQYVEEFPLSMLHRLPRLTGVRADDMVIVLVFEYGKNFSGPGKDTFHEERADSDPQTAHKSNFLHPVYYSYQKLPSESDMNKRKNITILPRPDRLHHTVEDFFTNFRNIKNHVLPLRRFVEHSIDEDLTTYTAEKCLNLALTSKTAPISCDNPKKTYVVSTNVNMRTS